MMENRKMQIKFFSNVSLIRDLEDRVNAFLLKEDIEVIKVDSTGAVVSILYYSTLEKQ